MRADGVEEWYLNGPAGLEQGFDLARTPEGSSSSPIDDGCPPGAIDRTADLSAPDDGCSCAAFGSSDHVPGSWLLVLLLVGAGGCRFTRSQS